MDCPGSSRTERLKDAHHLLIGCTGSVASVKIPQLVNDVLALRLTKPIEIQLVTTEHALHFFNHSYLPVKIHRDADEWSTWNKMKDPVLHVDLRRWADVLVIAPLDANTMAKMVNGICDNLLTCVVRAWDLAKPLLFCPAMNTYMWDHPITAKHVQALRELGYVEVPVVEKVLACGDAGYGAMAEVSSIVAEIECTLSTME